MLVIEYASHYGTSAMADFKLSILDVAELYKAGRLLWYFFFRLSEIMLLFSLLLFLCCCFALLLLYMGLCTMWVLCMTYDNYLQNPRVFSEIWVSFS